MKIRRTFSIAHLIWVTTGAAVATALLLSFISAYGVWAVAESVLAGLLLFFHAAFLLSLVHGAISKKLSMPFSASAFCVEIIGCLSIFGRYGIIGFVLSMTALMLSALLAGMLADWVSWTMIKPVNENE